MKFSNEQLKHMYLQMCHIRHFEEKVDYFFQRAMIHGTTHLYIGEEASAVGACNVMEKGGRPFGAVIVRNGEVVATGVNTVLETKDPTDHAEMRAIREASRALGSELLSDCEIYASGEPCPMCQGAIQRADLKAVYYASPKEVAIEAKVVPAGTVSVTTMSFSVKPVRFTTVRV